jgi:hypothetical protein
MLQSDNKIITTNKQLMMLPVMTKPLVAHSQHFPFVTTRKKSEIARTNNKTPRAREDGSAHRSEGDTDVFLHDVDWKVEREFTEELLCNKFRVGGVSCLWYFSIPLVSTRRNTLLHLVLRLKSDAHHIYAKN